MNRWFLVLVFLNSFLLFLVQPIIAKLLLPTFGGNQAVWTSCLCFFQGALLAGYFFTFLIQRLSTRKQTICILAIAFLSWFGLPFKAPDIVYWGQLIRFYPLRAIFIILFSRFFLPFFLLSIMSPLFLIWYSRRYSQSDPFFLFQASNFGSLAGLLLYPTVFEPNFTLRYQSSLWGFLFTCVAGGFIIRGFTIKVSEEFNSQETQYLPSSHSQKARWFLYAFIPSSYLLGVTNYLTTDLAPIPLIWVIPLSLYLVSHFLAFAKSTSLSYRYLQIFLFSLLVPLIALMKTQASSPLWFLFLFHLATFFLFSLLFHRQLANERPASDGIGEFYFLMGAGGFGGGIFNSVVAPQIFTGIVEYPIIVGLAALLLPAHGIEELKRSPMRLCAYFSLGLNVLFAVFLMSCIPEEYVSAGYFPQYLFLFFLFVFGYYSPGYFKATVFLLFLLVAYDLQSPDFTKFKGRSFYGSMQVSNISEQRANFLYNGSTNHGGQILEGPLKDKPLFYYYYNGPCGDIFRGYRGKKNKAPVGIVGLGTGGLAPYAEPNQNFVFFEIDPMVVKIARSSGLFSFLQDCPGNVNIEIGDGRLELNKLPDHSFGLLVLDAYSSDSIPVHLLTKEAFELYQRKLTKDGLLAFHISHRYLDLETVLGNICRQMKWHGYTYAFNTIEHATISEEEYPYVFDSRWVIMAKYKYNFGTILDNDLWKAVRESKSQVWTDSYSNILPIFKWR